MDIAADTAIAVVMATGVDTDTAHAATLGADTQEVASLVATPAAVTPTPVGA
jgi:hypothetical protein